MSTMSSASSSTNSLSSAIYSTTEATSSNSSGSFPQKPEAEIAAFFIHSTDYPQGCIFHTVKPEDISLEPPSGGVRRPAFPEKRKLSLQMLGPCIFFVQFPCRQKCRTMGICIHYQFVAGCQKCPDGLRCPRCMRSNIEQSIHALRKCPLHQDIAAANPINNRPEDFLASDMQKDMYDQVLGRSLACQWDDFPTTVARHSDNAEDQTLRHFDREATPKDMRDVEKMEGLVTAGADRRVGMPVTKSSLLLRGGPLDMGMPDTPMFSGTTYLQAGSSRYG